MSEAFLNYCRFCAEQRCKGNLLDLADVILQKQVQDKISIFHDNYIDLAADNALPKTICAVCNTDLDNAYLFLLKTQQSQTVLKSLFNDDKTLNNSSFDDVQTIAEPKKDESLDYDESDNTKIYQGLPIYNVEFIVKEENKLESEASAGLTETFSISKESVTSDLNDDDHNYCMIPTHDQNSGINSFDNNDSWTSYPWLCKHCDEMYTDIHLLREHSKLKHNLCCAFKCADCTKIFNYFDEFVQHVQEHRPFLRNYCQYCNIEFNNSDRDAHIYKHKTTEKICDLCREVFDNPQQLNEHKIKYKSPTQNINNGKKKRKKNKVYVVPIKEILNLKDKSWHGYAWSCQLCDSVFTGVEEIRSHTKEIHSKCFAVKCVDCGEIPDCYRVLVYHVRKHRPHLKKYCHYCNEELPTDEKTHITQHFANSEKVCESCGEIFPDKSVLQDHLATYNPVKPKHMPYIRLDRPLSVDDLTCDVCNKVCRNPSALRAHKTLHEDRQYACDRCGKMFSTKSSLVSHHAIHEDAKLEVCKICKNKFKTLPALKQHVRTHLGEKPFQCDVCQRSFRLKLQLVHHSIIHTDNLPFQCQNCDKAFRHKNNLKTHMNTHTGARPYICSDCGMDFTNWANCNKHMKRRHGTTLAKTVQTPQGKLPLNPKSLKPKRVKDNETVKEWTEQILAPVKRGKRNKNANTAENS